MPSDMLFSLIVLGLIAPLCVGFLAFFVGNDRISNKLVQFLFLASSLLGGLGTIGVLHQFFTGALQATILTIPGIPFTATLDVWSAFFLLLIHGGVCLASLFALGYLPKYKHVYSFDSLNLATALFVFGMQATVLASSVFVFLFFWEVMSVAAYFLVIADREEASLKAGFIYFVMTHLGVACLLAGFLLLAHGDTAATFLSLRAAIDGLPTAVTGAAFFLLFAGFGSKAGLIPLHQWLPYAHPQAPSHSSALMSGVMLKIAVYGFLRVVLFVFPTIPVSWAMVVIVIGLLSAFFGVLSAVVETDLKRLLAWSSIENLGLIFAMIGVGLAFQAVHINGDLFFVAALLHALNHTIFKSGLFLAAGAIISETHTRNLDEMGGLARTWPVFSAAFLGLVLAAVALPPFGTFYGEWLFFQGLASMLTVSKSVGFLSGIVLSVTGLVGGLALFAFAKTFSAVFLSKPRTQHAEHVKPLTSFLVWPIVLAAAASAGVGLFAAPLAERLGTIFGASLHPLSLGTSLQTADATIVPAAIFALFVALILVTMLFRRVCTAASRPIRRTDTWDCGQPITARMEYTATGFAAPLLFFFRSILLARKTLSTELVSASNPWIVRRRLTSIIQSPWEEYLYKPIVSFVLALATKIKRLQSGVIQFYILLILVTLVTVLIFAV